MFVLLYIYSKRGKFSKSKLSGKKKLSQWLHPVTQ